MIFQSLFHRIGAAVLAVLDSPGLFPPRDIEAAIVILRRHSEIVWLVPFFATAVSLIGTALAFWIGRKIGKNGLEHWISPGVMERVRREVTHKGTVALVLPALMPPPFPLLPFVLACGALSVSAMRFFLMFAALRFMRFSILTALLWFYGRQILTMFQTGTFKTVMAVFVVVIVVGISTTIYRLVKKMIGVPLLNSAERSDPQTTVDAPPGTPGVQPELRDPLGVLPRVSTGSTVPE